MAEEGEVARTVLCLSSPAARAGEAEVVRVLREKYGLMVKQRTERDLEEEEAVRVGEAYARFIDEREDERKRVEMESKVAESQKSSPRTSARGSPRSQADEEGSQASQEKARQREQARARLLMERRQERFERTSKNISMALQNRGPKDDVVVLSLLGVNAVDVLESALKDDAELRSLVGIVDDGDYGDDAVEIPDDYPLDEEGKEQEDEMYEGKEEEEKESDDEEGKAYDFGDDKDDHREQSEEEHVEELPSRYNVIFSLSASSAKYFREFFFDPPTLGAINFDAANQDGDRKKRSWSKRNPCVKKKTLFLEDLLAFIFPKEQQHPWSTGRMLVFGEYGPLDENGDLRSGMKGEHTITKHEICTMVKQIDLQDLLYIYVGDSVLSQEEQVEVAKQADPRIRGDKQLTREQVVGLFENLVPDEEGKLSFQDVQMVIFKFREDRIKRWKQMAVNSVRKAKPSKLEIERKIKHQKALRIASKLVLQPTPQIDDNDSFVMTTKLLNRFTFEICNLEDKNSAELVQNVRILRNANSKAVKYGAEPWRNIT